MIQVEAMPFNNFQVNTYLVWDETKECMVVDPSFYGDEEQEAFEESMRSKGLTLTGQINTHCHVDHVLGITYIKEKYGFPFRAHNAEAPIVESTPLMGELFGWSIEEFGSIDEHIEDHQEIKVGNHLLRSILVPGHSPGSLAFYSEEGSFVITGDALFQNSIGRTDLPGGDYDTLMESIRSRLMDLPPETTVFPGHGPSSTIGHEKMNNPFLQAV